MRVSTFRASFFRCSASLLMMTLLTEPAFAQEKKEVEILNADLLRFSETGDRKITSLSGNVALKQQDVLMYCDSALLDKEANTVDAYGHVHIIQDTTNVWSQMLFYNGNTKLAKLTGGVVLDNGSMRLYTSVLDYDMQQKQGYYLNKGKVVKGSTIINSRKGYYFEQTDDVYFRDEVVIVDSNFSLTSDTLRYQMGPELFTFYDNTNIYNKDSRIHCYTGTYNSKTDIATFGKRTTIYNPPQALESDELYYERFRGFARLSDNFHWVDSSMDAEIFAERGEYFEEKQFITAARNPLLIYKIENDSLFLTADTLKSFNKGTGDSTKTFYAYHHTRLFTRDLQGTCDSLFYSFQDSTFRFFYSPVLWNANTQISGDTMVLLTKKGKPHLLEVTRSGFIVSESDSSLALYDQIKGKYIYGWFDSSRLSKVNVVYNAESLYFGKDDKEKYMGANKASCAEMWLYFGSGKMQRINFIQKPEAVFTPIRMFPKEQYQLENFIWLNVQRPKKRSDVGGRWYKE